MVKSILLALFFCSLSNIAYSQDSLRSGRLFACEVQEAFWLSENGKLSPDGLPRFYVGRTIYFDEARETLRWSSYPNAVDTLSWQFTIAKHRESEGNSIVAVRIFEGLANTVVETFRIEVWKEGKPFFYDNAGKYFVGKCRIT